MNIQVSIANAIGADFIGKPNYITDSFINRVISDGGTFEAETCLANNLTDLAEISSDESPFPFGEYLAATGITGPTEVAAIYNLMCSLKQYGLWSKMKAVYPFVTDNRNLLSYTEDFSNAVWVTSDGCSVATNSAISPIGTLTADTVSFGTNTLSRIQQYPFALATYTYSVWLKTVSGTTTISFGNWDDFNTITVTSDWQRFTVTKTPTTNGVFTIRNNGAGNSSNIYVWGAQLELGSTATTYQPILGSQQAYISNQFKYNLVNPVDSDAAFRLVFNGGWTHSANGATPNGVNAYADTKLNILNTLSLTNSHHSAYLRTNYAISTLGAFGAESGTTTRMTFFPYTFNVGWGSDIYDNSQSRISSNTGNSTGYVIGSRASTSSHKLFRNGTEIASTTNNTNGSTPNLNYWIGGYNVSNALQFSIASQLSLYSIGDGLTDTEAANLYTAVQAFQTSLSRQV